ncbi:MAG: glycosyltransferase [Nocardioides sp.]|nr:glycosyltransferase [Nocardioides sp.]
MPATVIVEPDPGGHRFQAVASVARVSARDGDVVLLTSEAGAADEAFGVFLSDIEVDVAARFGAIHPDTREMAYAVADLARDREVATVIVMDADQSLKKWWYVARAAFKGLERKPRVIFMLTRYPARLTLRDSFGWKLRIAKGSLALLSRANGTVHRFAGFAGRDDMSKGWLVKRARDPEICLAHSRDRAQLREELDLPQHRRIVGIFGVLEERKNAPLILDSLDRAGLEDVDLLLAGGVRPEVWAWVNGLPPGRRARVIVRDGFLSNEEMDRLVAAVDACPIALTNNGPSGIMGKALAAGVPVVTTGSEVRAREVRATDGGVACEWSEASIGTAIREVLERDPGAPRRNTVPPATSEAFAETLLGVTSG